MMREEWQRAVRKHVENISEGPSSSISKYESLCVELHETYKVVSVEQPKVETDFVVERAHVIERCRKDAHHASCASHAPFIDRVGRVQPILFSDAVLSNYCGRALVLSRNDHSTNNISNKRIEITQRAGAYSSGIMHRRT